MFCIIWFLVKNAFFIDLSVSTNSLGFTTVGNSPWFIKAGEQSPTVSLVCVLIKVRFYKAPVKTRVKLPVAANTDVLKVPHHVCTVLCDTHRICVWATFRTVITFLFTVTKPKTKGVCQDNWSWANDLGEMLSTALILTVSHWQDQTRLYFDRRKAECAVGSLWKRCLSAVFKVIAWTLWPNFTNFTSQNRLNVCVRCLKTLTVFNTTTTETTSSEHRQVKVTGTTGIKILPSTKRLFLIA